MTEFKSRNVALVSLYIVSQLPDDQVEFKNDIMRFVKDLRYTPPEDMFISSKWSLLENIMKKYIPTINDIVDFSWKKKIVDIFIGKTMIPE